MKLSPGRPGASRPASQRSAVAPTSASGPSWRAPAVAPARRARAAPSRRSAPAAARTRACGRCPRGSGPRRGRPSRSAGRPRAAPPASARRARRARAARAAKPRDVLAVAVDLVGLDQVHEHQPALELARAARSTLASACAFVAPGVRVRRRRRPRTGRRSCRRRAPPRPRLRAPAGTCARAAPARSRAAPACARTRPRRPANGRAITRPTACSPLIAARAAAHAAYSSCGGTRSTCAASCSTESCEV